MTTVNHPAPRPPLAVITVTYSPGAHLAALADSLAQATAQDTVLVLADNGSTDGSVEAAADRGAVLLRTGGNLGYGRAINVAARWLDTPQAPQVDPDFLLVVNPDVALTPDSVDALLDCARRHPRAGAIGPRIQQPDGSAYPSARAIPRLSTGIGHAVLGQVWPGNPWTRRYRSGDGAAMARERTAGWLSGSCLLVRRQAFAEIGGFDERYFMYMEDVDFGDRLARAGWENVYCPESVITHDQGHVAGSHRGLTLPAHHASVYRFMADRLPGWPWAPVRLVLRAGLAARCRLQLGLDRVRASACETGSGPDS